MKLKKETYDLQIQTRLRYCMPLLGSSFTNNSNFNLIHMKTTIFINETDRESFEKRCGQKVSYTFRGIKNGHLCYDLGYLDGADLYYLGQGVMLDAFKRPVPFTEEEYLQNK